jgi:hypothetical protein
MPRDRNLAADLWTREALVRCRRDTRLLYVAMQNFADDHGVQPCSPFAIRLQVFPGDLDIDDANVQAMIDELVSRKLLRVYEVDGEAYVVIVHWAIQQSVSKRARRKYPADPAMVEKATPAEPAVTTHDEDDRGTPSGVVLEPPGGVARTVVSPVGADLDVQEQVHGVADDPGQLAPGAGTDRLDLDATLPQHD